ncbi:hypothetical protein Tco_0662214 [Tanacetum coccineum]
MKDFNNALLMFIKRTMIKNRVEDIQLGVESYQRTLNLTKPTMFFEGIDQRIPFTDQRIRGSCSETKGFEGRELDSTMNVKSSKQMLKKIDEILRHREQLRRLEEYVGGRPKTVNPFIIDIIKNTTFYKAFLASADVLEIYMLQFWFTFTKIKDTNFYEVKLANKKCLFDVEVLRQALNICPRVPEKEFIVPPSKEELLTFLIGLRYKGELTHLP